ncbi:hypothetical protein HPB52_013689 [Rhipicephalus sanguineus]|uniref:Uncharacterized protein n=1 Tax=Rhipicephalus sanguineus TaxID=34632 RepID=A0A9D4Q6V3_RHISA|nr:hypothetical protein HPB52_013689 [Rhipicephalus sanguineus]
MRNAKRRDPRLPAFYQWQATHSLLNESGKGEREKKAKSKAAWRHRGGASVAFRLYLWLYFLPPHPPSISLSSSVIVRATERPRKKYELAQSTISTILKAGSTALLKAGTSGHTDERKRVREPLAWYEVRQTIIQNCFRKAGSMRHDQPPSPSDSETRTETADLTELWEHVAAGDEDSGCVASVEDFLMADSAASFCDELTDEAIVADVFDSSDEEADSASMTPSMTTQGALTSVGSLIKKMPPEFSQQLEAMRTALV